jgi:hypothetical protein
MASENGNEEPIDYIIARWDELIMMSYIGFLLSENILFR